MFGYYHMCFSRIESANQGGGDGELGWKIEHG
jgi:hypothetical protein